MYFLNSDWSRLKLLADLRWSNAWHVAMSLSNQELLAHQLGGRPEIIYAHMYIRSKAIYNMTTDAKVPNFEMIEICSMLHFVLEQTKNECTI